MDDKEDASSDSDQEPQSHQNPPQTDDRQPITTAPHAPLPATTPSDTRKAFDSRFIAEAFDKVPQIGEGSRWFDYPYRTLDWLQRSWRRRLFPQRVLSGMNYLSNLLIPFEELEREKIWSGDDPLHNLFVPSDEHVTLPAVWVVELFPPSEIESLTRTIAKNSWDRGRVFAGTGESNREMLERSRGEAGWTWWRLAEIVSPNSGFWYPDGTREDLPEGIDSIELKAMQIGTGLTAVVACVMLTDTAATNLDRVWHEKHEPRLTIKGQRRTRVEDRMWAGMHKTQEARRALHDRARGWLKKRCPGFFASNRTAQPVIDLLLLDRFDPTQGLRQERKLSDSLRALGLDDGSILQRISPSLPGLILSPNDPGLNPTIGHRAAALWGNAKIVAAGQRNLQTFGKAPDRAIARAVHRTIDTFLVLMAISDLLTDVEKRYATLRDTARIRHGEFQTKDIRELRANLLTLSLDLASISRDVLSFWDASWRSDDVQFVVMYTDEFNTTAAAAGHPPIKPRSVNGSMHDDQKERFQRLHNMDGEYRSILSTVASLGASVDTFKVSRLAIWVAAASLVVAIVTLLLSNPGPESLLNSLLRWWQHSS